MALHRRALICSGGRTRFSQCHSINWACIGSHMGQVDRYHLLKYVCKVRNGL